MTGLESRAGTSGFIVFRIFYLMCMSALLTCIYVHHVQAPCPEMPDDPRALELQLVGSCLMWVLRREPKSSVRAASDPNP